MRMLVLFSYSFPCLNTVLFEHSFLMLAFAPLLYVLLDTEGIFRCVGLSGSAFGIGPASWKCIERACEHMHTFCHALHSHAARCRCYLGYAAGPRLRS